MAWMKLDHWLPSKPEVIEIKLLTKSTLAETIGRLVLVWIWFSEQTVTGQSRDCPGLVDDIAGHQGFYEALRRVGWLVSDGPNMRMPNFERWLGSALEARRRAKNRVSGTSPGQSRDKPGTIRTQTQTQTQKKKRTPKSPPSGSPASQSSARPPSKAKKPIWTGTPPEQLRTPEFDQAWLNWLAYRSEEIRKPVTQRSGDMALGQLASIGPARAVAAIKHTIAMGWQGLREPEPGRNGQVATAAPPKAKTCARCGTTHWSSLTKTPVGEVCSSCYREVS